MHSSKRTVHSVAAICHPERLLTHSYRVRSRGKCCSQHAHAGMRHLLTSLDNEHIKIASSILRDAEFKLQQGNAFVLQNLQQFYHHSNASAKRGSNATSNASRRSQNACIFNVERVQGACARQFRLGWCRQHIPQEIGTKCHSLSDSPKASFDSQSITLQVCICTTGQSEVKLPESIRAKECSHALYRRKSHHCDALEWEYWRL